MVCFKACHTISIWLTVTLAAWRYIMVALPLRNKTLCTMQRAKVAVGVAYVSSLFLCVPSFLTFSLTQTNMSVRMKTTRPTTTPPSLLTTTSSYFGDAYSTVSSVKTSPTSADGYPRVSPRYVVYYSKLALAHNRLLVQANFWIYR
jgi:hypothetical protein